MIIKQIKEELKSAKNPIAKSLHHNATFRVLVLGFRKGMVMKSHTAKWPSKLTVLEGSVTYQEEKGNTVLNQYDEFEIPVGVVHSVEANKDSLCLLTQSDD
ncbi:cupin domain-containing protein [uncultured Croceitalea sp.]|uniref:cupin domain-containing protein n=1 Tax=uncultured Croceitalea sp. TaxID=1798908 RepID=UPI00374F7CD8